VHAGLGHSLALYFFIHMRVGYSMCVHAMVTHAHTITRKGAYISLEKGRLLEKRAATTDSVVIRICTTVHHLYTRFAKAFGASISEAAARPNHR
jgi:hypothetical protein